MSPLEIAVSVIFALALLVVWGFAKFALEGVSRLERALDGLKGSVNTIREDVEQIVKVEHPVFRRYLPSKAPVPLRRVICFRLGLGEKFWKQVLQLSHGQFDSVRKMAFFGPPFPSLPGYWDETVLVVLRQWRSHLEFSVSDPVRGSARQSVTVYYMDHYMHDWLTLWSLELPKDEGEPTDRLSARLQLVWQEGTFKLGATAGRFGFSAVPREWARDENIFLEVSADGQALESFKRPDEEQNLEVVAMGGKWPYKSEPWHIMYERLDESKDLYWDLDIRDLQRWADR